MISARLMMGLANGYDLVRSFVQQGGCVVFHAARGVRLSWTHLQLRPRHSHPHKWSCMRGLTLSNTNGAQLTRDKGF